MSKDRSYHTSAIVYNDGLAEVAEDLAEEVEHPEVQKWCRAVGKQHRFHSKRHKAALRKLDEAEADGVTGGSVNIEHIPEGLDVPKSHDLSDEEVARLDAVVELEQTAANLQPDTLVKDAFEKANHTVEGGMDSNYHDAGTGKFVSEEYAKENPETTVEVTEDSDEVEVVEEVPAPAEPIVETPDETLAAEPVLNVGETKSPYYNAKGENVTKEEWEAEQAAEEGN